ncbi:MAG: class I SAM-dependent methyltransferase [Candidatus Hodarchaeales archaeon]|jgi:ubiquinone/menaquinone biosynthesis C-methylase UbiE
MKEIVEQIFPNEEFIIKNGILYHKGSLAKEKFSNLYFKMRTHEKRILTDKILNDLPLSDKNWHMSNEWKVKKLSIKILLKEINKQSEIHNILDLGSGNGWLSNFLSKKINSIVVGIDVNRYELEQARRVFGNNKKLIFINCDIDTIQLASKSIDIIILSSSIQYFSNFEKLLTKLLNSLTKKGAIFIFGSIFYSNKTIIKAKKNTIKYYNEIGFPELSSFYHHHQIENLAGFNFKTIFDPSKLYRRILRKLFPSVFSPFYFIKIIK